MPATAATTASGAARSGTTWMTGKLSASAALYSASRDIWPSPACSNGCEVRICSSGGSGVGSTNKAQERRWAPAVSRFSAQLPQSGPRAGRCLIEPAPNELRRLGQRQPAFSSRRVRLRGHRVRHQLQPAAVGQLRIIARANQRNARHPGDVQAHADRGSFYGIGRHTPTSSSTRSWPAPRVRLAQTTAGAHGALPVDPERGRADARRARDKTRRRVRQRLSVSLGDVRRISCRRRSCGGTCYGHSSRLSTMLACQSPSFT